MLQEDANKIRFSEWRRSAESGRGHSRLHSSRMRVSRVALLASVLLVAVAATFAQGDPCALTPNTGVAWVGKLDTYVFCASLPPLIFFPALPSSGHPLLRSFHVSRAVLLLAHIMRP